MNKVVITKMANSDKNRYIYKIVDADSSGKFLEDLDKVKATFSFKKACTIAIQRLTQGRDSYMGIDYTFVGEKIEEEKKPTKKAKNEKKSQD